MNEKIRKTLVDQAGYWPNVEFADFTPEMGNVNFYVRYGRTHNIQMHLTLFIYLRWVFHIRDPTLGSKLSHMGAIHFRKICIKWDNRMLDHLGTKYSIKILAKEIPRNSLNKYQSIKTNERITRI